MTSSSINYHSPFCSILFCFVLSCDLPLEEAAFRQSPPAFSALYCPCPYCSLLPQMSSFQRFGLPTDLTPFICYSVLIMIHQLSFIRAMRAAHFHLELVTYSTMSVTPFLCLLMLSRIKSFSLTFSIFVSIARWSVSSFFTNALVRDHIWHPCVIASKTHW